MGHCHVTVLLQMAATDEPVAMGNAESVSGEVTFPPIPVRDLDSLNPTTTWEKLSVKHKVKKVAPLSFDTPKPEGHTRFVCISDTHNRTNADTFVPEGDVLLHAGDFSMVGAPGEIEQFVGFMKTLPHKHKVCSELETHTVLGLMVQEKLFLQGVWGLPP